MLDGTLFFVKSAEYRNRGKDVFPDFVLYIVLTGCYSERDEV